MITTHLLLSLDPTVNFKASGCEHERLVVEYGGMSPSICLTYVVICPHVLGTADKYDILEQAVLLLCDVRIQDVGTLEARMLSAFFPLFKDLNSTELYSVFINAVYSAV